MLTRIFGIKVEVHRCYVCCNQFFFFWGGGGVTLQFLCLFGVVTMLYSAPDAMFSMGEMV